MKQIIFSIILGLVTGIVTAQSGYDAVLTQVEANSTQLQVLRDQMEAQKLGNRTGIYLSNPEVEFNYLWGNPSVIGNRTDFAISQSFDFPTAYGHRNQISKLENANAELAYKAERLNLLLRAKQVCIDLVYYNALANEYVSRLSDAEQMASAYQSKMKQGEANAIENNKAQINRTAVRNEVARIEAERSMLVSSLKRMNGGKDIDFSQNSYASLVLPIDFDEWYLQTETKSPTLQYISGQIGIGEKQIKLNRAMGLPKFSAGYMSEKIVGERFQGISLGISIPLWQNKNKVKHAQAQMTAKQSALADTKVQFYHQLQGLYRKANHLQKSAVQYRLSLTSFNNKPLLKKALEAGEISLLTYLMEITLYYGAVDNVLEAEKSFELAMAELSAVEL